MQKELKVSAIFNISNSKQVKQAKIHRLSSPRLDKK